MRHYLLLLALSLGLLRPTFAQRGPITPPAVQVHVTCDHADWLYAPGDPVKFTVKVIASNAPLAGAGSLT